MTLRKRPLIIDKAGELCHNDIAAGNVIDHPLIIGGTDG